MPIRANDGWILLDAYDREHLGPVLRALVESVGTGPISSDDVEAVLLRLFAEQPVAHWVRYFAGRSIQCVRVVTDLADLGRDPRFDGCFDHEGCLLPRAPWRFRNGYAG